MCFGPKKAATKAEPTPAPAPPVTEHSASVKAASNQARRDATRRNGYRKTLIAGETGGALTTPPSILGG